MNESNYNAINKNTSAELVNSTFSESSRTGNEDDISLKEIILKVLEWGKYFLSKWLYILVSALVFGVLGYFFAHFKNPDYIAEYSFVLEEEKAAGIGGLGGIVTQLGIDGGGSDGVFAGDNLFQLIKSRRIIQNALLKTLQVDGKTITFAEFYIDINENLQKVWANQPELLNMSFSPDTDPSEFTLAQNSVLGILHKSVISQNLTIDKPDKKLSFISIKVTSKNEQFSKDFAEILTKEVSEFYIETKTKKSAKNLAILQHQTDSVRRAINYSFLGVASSLDANPNPNPSRLVLKVPSQFKQIEVQANTAMLSELVKNLEFAKITLRKETPLIQIIDSPILPLPKQSVSKTKWTLIGVFLGSALMIGIILVIRIYKNVMA